MFQEFREQKERELTELMAIKSDLEVRLHRVSEEDRETSGYLMGELATSLHCQLHIRVCVCMQEHVHIVCEILNEGRPKRL